MDKGEGESCLAFKMGYCRALAFEISIIRPVPDSPVLATDQSVNQSFALFQYASYIRGQYVIWAILPTRAHIMTGLVFMLSEKKNKARFHPSCNLFSYPTLLTG